MLVKRFSSKLLQSQFVYYCCLGALLFSLQLMPVFGAATVEQFVRTVRTTFTLVKDLMIIVAFVCGMVFSFIGLLKFKAHKEAPGQIPLSTPIVLIAVSAGLLFLPTFFELIGSALFNEAAQPGLPLSKTLNI